MKCIIHLQTICDLLSNYRLCVDEKFMEYIETTGTWGSGVCAWIIHYHHFWKLEYGGQKLVEQCRFIFRLSWSSKNRKAGASLSFYYKSWHHDTYNDVPTVSPETWLWSSFIRFFLLLDSLLPLYSNGAPNTRAGRIQVWKTLEISSVKLSL